MTDACTPLDRSLLVSAALALGGLGIATLATTPLGLVDQGWANGSYQRGYETRFEESLPTAQSAAQLFAALKLTLLGEVAEGAVLGREGWLFTAEEFTAPPEARDLRSELERVRSALGPETTLLPIIVPDKARIMAEKLPRGRSAPFNARYDTALAAISATGLPIVDLRTSLSAVDQPFMRTDTHWSPRGADAVAQTIAVHVAQHGPALPKSATTLASIGVERFTGDLRAFADAGAWAPYAGLSDEEIEKLETHVAPQGGLFGDVPVEVVLVGTSFSARPDFHFEGFLKHHLGADILNLADVGRGPFLPMDRALDELSALPTPPRLVIWEVPERYLALPEHP